MTMRKYSSDPGVVRLHDARRHAAWRAVFPFRAVRGLYMQTLAAEKSLSRGVEGSTGRRLFCIFLVAAEMKNKMNLVLYFIFG
jgi:hypothetical protein